MAGRSFVVAEPDMIASAASDVARIGAAILSGQPLPT
ncbi:hypothetical protein LAUMK4_02192 [Mycobacterium persicum]|uniref:Uncharacterized protein n=1 Tax=Mycobacterium persicum TaxID=1487726 RepID=A0AB38USW8_9MYCO|nr:hypothetical protein LAUMK22_02053 [Mycobacterium kansasii]VAZ74877.1 hypothetical protein LAUMK15_02517 [Mycobacterium persicum]VAZ83521.1 hypothetical protein LAUMK42_02338 [Mycobacterium persicum]VAZ92709.1 hypothetical protein LAUMK4_02192 [Mycobacterium persicum]